jgi:type VI secretion system secreted protein Hcp
MAHSIFCKVDGIPGASTVEKHKDEIEVLTFQYGVTHPYSGGRSSGERQHSNVTIEKLSDKASGPLMLSCVNGTVLKQVQLNFYKEDRSGKEEVYATITLKNAAVASWTAEGKAGDGRPGFGETVAFTFEEIMIEGKDVGTASDSYRKLG